MMHFHDWTNSMNSAGSRFGGAERELCSGLLNVPSIRLAEVISLPLNVKYQYSYE